MGNSVDHKVEISKPLKELFDGAELNALAALIDDLPDGKQREQLEHLMWDLWFLGGGLMSNGHDYGIREQRKYPE